MAEIKLNRNLLLYCIAPFLLGAVLFLCPQPAAANSDKSQSANESGVVNQYEKEPLRLTAIVDRVKINVAMHLQLELQAETNENYHLEFPEPGEDFGNFSIVGIHKGKPQLTSEGRVVTKNVYILEPQTTGEFEIPALKVSTWQKGQEDTEVVELSTETIQVTVESLLPDNQKPVLSDIAPPVTQPVNPVSFIVLGAIVLVIIILAFVWWKKRKKKVVAPPPPLPPHVIADRALDRLLADDLLAQGKVKLYYARLSDILRHYIEHRFGLRAPERTTEEFLNELGSHGSMIFQPNQQQGQHNLAGYQELLQDFLNHCDLVKFAKHQPERMQADESVGLCRKFIEETAMAFQTNSNGASGKSLASSTKELSS